MKQFDHGYLVHAGGRRQDRPGWHHDGVRIEIIVFDGFDELDAFGPLEVLKVAASCGAGFEVTLVGADGPGRVRTESGIELIVPAGIGDPDGVVVIGGGWLSRAPEGAWAQAQRGELPATLARLARSVRWTASVCAGAMLLAAAGLLRDRPATTNHRLLAELGATGARVLENRVVDDGDIVTCGGITAGIDLALWLTEREADPELATKVAHLIEYRPVGDVWRRGTAA
jgi:transcriptional regulator GlxA family with amidase domain